MRFATAGPAAWRLSNNCGLCGAVHGGLAPGINTGRNQSLIAKVCPRLRRPARTSSDGSRDDELQPVEDGIGDWRDSRSASTEAPRLQTAISAMTRVTAMHCRDFSRSLGLGCISGVFAIQNKSTDCGTSGFLTCYPQIPPRGHTGGDHLEKRTRRSSGYLC
jgi:hypothetical protein